MTTETKDTKGEQKMMTGPEIVAELEVRIPRMKVCEDFTDKQFREDLKFVKAQTRLKVDYPSQLEIFDKEAELGVVQIFRDIWKEYFTGKVDMKAKGVLKYALECVWNGSDKSQKMREELLKLDVPVYLLKCLQTPALDPESQNTSMVYLIEGITGVLHNMIQHCDVREIYRENNAVQIFQKLRVHENQMVQSEAEILLAYVVNEDEYDIINSDDKSIQFIIFLLRDASGYSTHHSTKTGFSAIEVMAALNKLAANDSNKNKIIDHGALPLYIKMLDADCTMEEKKVASNGLWTLSFTPYGRSAIQNSAECMEGNAPGSILSCSFSVLL